MDQDQTTEYVTAFVIGTIVGVGAALLLAPDPPTRREKIMKDLKPYRKKLKKRTARARKEFGKQASAAGDFRDELLAAGRSVVSDLRDEVAELVADARDEIASSLESQISAAQEAVKKGAKRVRS
jgi:gas vesicle protein